MPEKGWKSVSLPEAVINNIKVIVEKNPNYASVAEFIRDALRRYFKELEDDFDVKTIEEAAV